MEWLDEKKKSYILRTIRKPHRIGYWIGDQYHISKNNLEAMINDPIPKMILSKSHHGKKLKNMDNVKRHIVIVH